jgi:hypothetical protein
MMRRQNAPRYQVITWWKKRITPYRKMENPRPAFDEVTQAERDEERVSLFWILSDLASPMQSHA